MKNNSLLNLIVAFLFLNVSCSTSNDPSLEDKMIGNWTGTLVQPEFGELITNFTISSSSLNQKVGNGTFKSGDISPCDDTQFNCAPLACSFNLTLLKTSGTSSFELDQMLIETNSTCGDGIFQLNFVDNNTMNVTWYEEAFPENKATGILKKL